jgi:hypothetical protein
MLEMTVPWAHERWATMPAPDPASLLEQLATLRPENVALRTQAVPRADEVVGSAGAHRYPTLPVLTGYRVCRARKTA